MIHATVVQAAHQYGVRKLLYLGSSCIYPREARQPMTEEQLLTGALEPTNEAYAIAKIAGIKLCQSYRTQYGNDFISAMPTNLYGPNDNFDPATSHVLPAMIRRFHEARVLDLDRVTIWGTGTPRREFLHVDDLADATIHTLTVYDDDLHLNIGTGEDISISELASMIAEIVGWRGEITYDTSMPDGTPRKLLDVSRLQSLGWRPSISLAEGIKATYAWFVDNLDRARGTGNPTA
jgi:GDP-L-fucose synthase